MFDIGFWELSLIAVIALLILGPERLPRAARQAGLWAGKMRRMVNDVRSNISEELRMEELNALKQAGQDLKENLQSAQKEIGSVEDEVKRSVGEISKEAEGVDIVSAIGDSAPTTDNDAGRSPAAPGTSGYRDAGQSGTRDHDLKTPAGNDVKKAAAPAAAKDKITSSVKVGSSAKARDDKKGKKPKKSGKKSEKAKPKAGKYGA